MAVTGFLPAVKFAFAIYSDNVFSRKRTEAYKYFLHLPHISSTMKVVSQSYDDFQRVFICVSVPCPVQFSCIMFQIIIQVTYQSLTDIQ